MKHRVLGMQRHDRVEVVIRPSRAVADRKLLNIRTHRVPPLAPGPASPVGNVSRGERPAIAISSIALIGNPLPCFELVGRATPMRLVAGGAAVRVGAQVSEQTAAGGIVRPNERATTKPAAAMRTAAPTAARVRKAVADRRPAAVPDHTEALPCVAFIVGSGR